MYWSATISTGTWDLTSLRGYFKGYDQTMISWLCLDRCSLSGQKKHANGQWSAKGFPLTVVDGQLGNALQRTSHEVSLQQTSKSWNSAAIFINFPSRKIMPCLDNGPYSIIPELCVQAE